MVTELTTCGVFFVHSIPRALCSHAQWALADVLGYDVRVDWTAQPVGGQGLVRGELGWVGKTGTGAVLASALRGWGDTRYEVTEDSTSVSVGGRWFHTPELGIFHAQTDLYGNVVVPENRLRVVLSAAGPQEATRAINLALGTAWDEELEPYRYAGEDAPVKWAHRAV